MEKAKARILEPKLVLPLIGLLVIWLVFISFAPADDGQTATGEKAIVSFKVNAENQTVLDRAIQVEKGSNAFDAMQKVATLEYQDYGEMGILVESINGIKPKENEFWSLYLDGEMAMVGISSIIIEENTTIEWKTESMEAYTG